MKISQPSRCGRMTAGAARVRTAAIGSQRPDLVGGVGHRRAARRPPRPRSAADGPAPAAGAATAAPRLAGRWVGGRRRVRAVRPVRPVATAVYRGGCGTACCAMALYRCRTSRHADHCRVASDVRFCDNAKCLRHRLRVARDRLRWSPMACPRPRLRSGTRTPPGADGRAGRPPARTPRGRRPGTPAPPRSRRRQDSGAVLLPLSPICQYTAAFPCRRPRCSAWRSTASCGARALTGPAPSPFPQGRPRS